MGVMVEFTGGAVEQVGMAEAVAVLVDLDMTCKRIDLAMDHCPFTPQQVADAWMADEVRTRSKVPKDAWDDRQWRSCGWDVKANGDTFRMGARQSEQFGRCYNRRGFTRFELELKGRTAHVAFLELAALFLGGAPELAPASLSWVRRFVDFVDPASSTHASRRTLLPWWSAFVDGAARAEVVVTATVVRTVEEARDWVVRQVAPTLALLASALGVDDLVRLAQDARSRMRPRHRAMLSRHRMLVAQTGATLGT
jgi:DNA relaxase NicK